MSPGACESVAAWESYELLKAAAKREFRFEGDTKTAARDRAAQKAGVTPAQAERLWKNWRTMKFPNGDVYRLLRNEYGHLCDWLESKADALEARRLGRNGNAVVESSETAAARAAAGHLAGEEKVK